MSLDTIYEILQQAAPNNQLDLSPSAFGTGPIATLFNTYLPHNGHLRANVTSLAKDEPNQRVVLMATGTSIPLKGMSITAYFYDSADGVQVQLSGTAPSQWKLSDSFPLFAFGFTDNLVLSASILSLVSDSSQPSGSGQFLSSHLLFQPPWNAIAWLFAGPTGIPLA